MKFLETKAWLKNLIITFLLMMSSIIWMNNMKLYLGSKSPRRKELLSQLYLNFEIIEAGVDECSSETDPKDFVLHIARLKGEAVVKKLNTPSFVISADTIVVGKKRNSWQTRD